MQRPVFDAFGRHKQVDWVINLKWTHTNHDSSVPETLTKYDITITPQQLKTRVS